MKWFKLDSNFFYDNRILECKEKYGLQGFNIYLTLLGIMAEQWNGEPDKTFIILESHLVRTCSTYRPKLGQTMSELGSLFGWTCTKVGPNYHIQYPKFLKKQESYFRGALTERTRIRLEENRIEEIRIDLKNKPKEEEVAKALKTPRTTKTKISTDNNIKTWEAYKKAYEERYKTFPARNAMVNKQISNFVCRLGEKAPEVAEFYVKHNNYFYVSNCHSVGIMLKDAEKLHTEFQTNIRMTNTRARQIDQIQTNFDAFDRVIEEYQEEKNGKGAKHIEDHGRNQQSGGFV